VHPKSPRSRQVINAFEDALAAIDSKTGKTVRDALAETMHAVGQKITPELLSLVRNPRLLLDYGLDQLDKQGRIIPKRQRRGRPKGPHSKTVELLQQITNLERAGEGSRAIARKLFPGAADPYDRLKKARKRNPEKLAQIEKQCHEATSKVHVIQPGSKP